MREHWKLRPWGRHNLILMIAGAGYLLIGISFKNVKLNQIPKKQLVNLTLALRWIPLDIWGWVFIVAGLMVLLSSSWPRNSKMWGYTVLTLLSALWSGFYFASVIVYRSTVNNLGGGLTWGLFAFLWWAIGGLQSPTKGETHESG